MAVELVMPRLSESMEEGTIVSWLVPDGSQVRQGDEIAEIETDKSTLPYEAPETGVLRILVPEGSTLALGQPIGLIDDLVPLAGGQSVAPPGPPQSPDAAWSPAWGPQSAASRGSADGTAIPGEDEGETTEFASLGSPTPSPEPAPVAAPDPHADRAAILADDGSQGHDTLFGDVTPDEAAADAVATADATEALIAAMPWVDASFSPKGAPTAPTAQAEDGLAPAAPAQPLAANGGRRFTPDELIAPTTLPPRPPQLQPTATAGARIPASPVARRLARELGIDLATIHGTGPEGRVVRADIEAAQATGAARPPKQAAAAPTAASEFTPPVDDARASAPIPTVEPEAEALTPEAAETKAEPSAEAPADLVVESDLIAETGPAPEAEPSASVETLPDPEPSAEPVAPPTAEPDAGARAERAVEPEPAEATAEVATPSEARVLPAAQPGRGKGEPTIVELTRQAQTVARRMAESKATIPDFHTVMEVDATPLLALRAELTATRPDLAAPSVNDLLVKATAIALRAFPALNGAYRDGRLVQYPRVNVGIAVDADGTLLVPVVHDADQLSVSQIAARTDEVVAKAKDGSLRPPDIASATFTLSNLGVQGVTQFTAVITPGQAGLLTAGAIADRPVVRDGAVVAGQTLILTLTTDHRAIYGAEAARFLGRLRQLLEHPSSLLA